MQQDSISRTIHLESWLIEFGCCVGTVAYDSNTGPGFRGGKPNGPAPSPNGHGEGLQLPRNGGHISEATGLPPKILG
jgi:hypothetical protein